jgi:hypothetical protein
LKGPTSEKTPVATVSTISGTKNEQPIQVDASKQKAISLLLTLFPMQELNCIINRNILLNFKQGIGIEGTSNNDQGKYF